MRKKSNRRLRLDANERSEYLALKYLGRLPAVEPQNMMHNDNAVAMRHGVTKRVVRIWREHELFRARARQVQAPRRRIIDAMRRR